MKPTAFLSFLSLAIVVFVACQKELTLDKEAITGTSTGSIKSLTGDCTFSSVSGFYKEGTSLNAANHIDVEVNVLTAGSYKVLTDTVNGLYFKIEGLFATGGTQTVRLIGDGVPITDGTVPYRIRYGKDTCIINLFIADASATAAEFTFGAGTDGKCAGTTLAGTYKAGAAMKPGNTASLTLNVTKAGSYAISTVASNGLAFYGSGVITNTGNQVIVLSAYGTPVTTGATTISPANDGNSCNFTVLVQSS